MTKKRHSIFLLTALLLAGLSSCLVMPTLSTISAIMIGILVIVEDEQYDFYTLLASSLFFNAIAISGNLMMNVFVYIYVFKCLASNKIQVYGWTSGLYILLCLVVFMQDIIKGTFTNALWSLDKLLWLFTFVLAFNPKQYNHKYAIILLFISLCINNICNIFNTPDLASLGDASILHYRLGEGDVDAGTSNNLGGAMDFPVRTILAISLAMPLLVKRTISKVPQIIIAMTSVALLIITFFTTSRVYLIGIGVFVIMLILSTLRSPRKAIPYVIILGVVLYFVLDSSFSDVIINRYLFRTVDASDFSNGREAIWNFWMEYLSNHPLVFLFGLGLSYQAAVRDMISVTATHNIILDSIVSFGLIGSIILIVFLINFAKRLRIWTNFSPTIISSIPLICWLAMSMTSTVFSVPYTYAILPFMVIHLYYCQTITSKDENSYLYS